MATRARERFGVGRELTAGEIAVVRVHEHGLREIAVAHRGPVNKATPGAFIMAVARVS